MLSKKNLSLIVGLVLIVCAAVYINWRYSGALEIGTDATGSEAVDDYGEARFVSGSNSSYFQQARLTRQTTRDDAIEQLEGIVDNPNAAKEARDKALETIASYAKNTETEGRIENLIRAKGFDECVVFIGPDSVSVVIKSKTLVEDGTAKITDIVVKEAGVRASQLKIMEIG